MKRLVPLAALLSAVFVTPAALATPSAPSELSIGDRTYNIAYLGQYAWAHPTELRVSPELRAGAAPACDALRKNLADFESVLSICQKDPGFGLCNTARDTVYRAAEGRAPSDPAWEHHPAVTIALNPQVASADAESLREAVASASGQPLERVRLALAPPADTNVELTQADNSRAEEAADSLLRKAASYGISFPPEALGRWQGWNLTLTNRFAACDLLEGKLRFSGRARTHVAQAEAPTATTRATAWSAYQKLAPFFPGLVPFTSLSDLAAIGGRIGQEAPELVTNPDPWLNVAAFSRLLFAAGDGVTRLGAYSRADFDGRALTDQLTYHDFYSTWSTQ